jgi:hypothetical protein
VCHQSAHLVGIRGHERERGHRAAAAREHLDRPAAERFDADMDVVAAPCG